MVSILRNKRFQNTYLENNIEKENLLLYILRNRTITNDNYIPRQGELQISVKTATCNLNVSYDIPTLCKEIDNLLKNRNKINSDGKRKGSPTHIQNVIYSKIDKDILTKNSKSNNNFFNSISIVINIREKKNINLKLFTNGKITCTGCKYDEDGEIAVKFLIEEMKKFQNVIKYDESNVNKEIKIENYEIVMINSNFSIGFFIDNHKLYNILLENRNKYNLFVDYDPESYQGVKIYFMWNKNQTEKNGVCVCKKKCKYTAKKKCGNGENDCRRISIAVFSTGKILIAGAKNSAQLDATYNFVVNLLQSNYKEIVRHTFKEKEEILSKLSENNIIVKK